MTGRNSHRKVREAGMADSAGLAEAAPELAEGYVSTLVGRAEGTRDAYRRELVRLTSWVARRPGAGAVSGLISSPARRWRATWRSWRRPATASARGPGRRRWRAGSPAG
jgi:hypothetical protein